MEISAGVGGGERSGKTEGDMLESGCCQGLMEGNERRWGISVGEGGYDYICEWQTSPMLDDRR